MALEKVGLGGILTFDEKQAVRGMSAATRASNLFSKSFNQVSTIARAVGSSMSQLSGAARSFGVAALPATAAIGFGTKQAVDFEKQMSAVQAITGATADQMQRLEREAKKQGATTAFSATQAGQGMEFLSRAGFSVEEQLSAIGPLLNAAAADGIDLATTADIVSNTLRGLNLPASDAARAADVLALTSARTNTNLIAMGEAMTYAAPQAKTLNVDLETTAAILGAVADAGLRGSIGGTSFTQALVKLTKPSKEGEEYLRKFNVQMTKTADGGLDVVDVFKQINKGLNTVSDVTERARIQTEIFGVRGQKAFAAAATAIDTGKLDQLVEQLQNAEGAAERMAKTRLSNLAGAFTLLRSAAEGFALETAGLFLGPMKEGVVNFTDNLSNVVLVLQELNSEQGLTEETAKKAGTTIVEVAKGIKEGIETVIDSWRTFRNQVTSFVSEFTGKQSQDTIRQFTKIATIIFIVAGAVAPVMLAIGGLGLFVSSVIIPVFGALGGVFTAVFGGVMLPILAALGGAFLLIRKDGESVGQTFSRVWEMIKQGFDYVMNTAINPFIAGFQAIPGTFEPVQEAFTNFIYNIRNEFGDIINFIIQAVQYLQPVFKMVFAAIGGIVKIAMKVMGFLFIQWLDVVTGVVRTVKNIAFSLIESVVNFIKGAAEILGTLADLVGMDTISKQLMEFGKGEFRISVGGERGITPPKPIEQKKPPKIEPEESAALMSTELSQMSVDQGAGLMSIDPGSVDAIGQKVGDAVGSKMPKDINVNSRVCVDGKNIAKATARHKQEINERSGFKATPWQRRISVEHGAAPVGGV